MVVPFSIPHRSPIREALPHGIRGHSKLALDRDFLPMVGPCHWSVTLILIESVRQADLNSPPQAVL